MTNNSTITVRGYAVPFGQTAHVGDGALEQFAPGAFSEMLARRNHAIELRWLIHDDAAPQLANTSARSLSFFEDEYGLGFYAVLGFKENWRRVSSLTQKKNPVAQCSIGGLRIVASRRERTEVGTAEIIERAMIDHITICDNPAYRGTAVWPAHRPLDEAPLKIQDLAARWEDGRAAWNRRMERKSTAKTLPGCSPEASAGVVAMIQSRRTEIMRLRNAFAANPAAVSDCIIMGHIAFSEAADRIFGKLRR